MSFMGLQNNHSETNYHIIVRPSRMGWNIEIPTIRPEIPEKENDEAKAKYLDTIDEL